MRAPGRVRTAFLLVLSAGAHVWGAPVVAEQPGIRIVSPAPGRFFAPGDKVAIEVEVDASLHATDGLVVAARLGMLKASEFTGTGFRATLVIPIDYAGPIVLTPSVVAGEFLSGPDVTINVRPRGALTTMRVLNRNHVLSPSSGAVQIYVKGTYEDGIKRELTSSVSGTTFRSSDPAVVSVDTEGSCRVVGRGNAVITVENGGVRDFVTIVVEDPEHPNPPTDQTSRVSMTRGPQRSEENGHRVLQTITLKNTSDLPIMGPLYLVAANVPDGARPRSDAFSVSLPDGLNLFPGQSVKVQLMFLLWKDVAVTYDLRLVDREPTTR